MIARRLKSLFGGGGAGGEAASSNGAHVPPGERLYAIGDVHGRLDLLTHLLDAIDRDDAARGAAETRIVLLGDLVDRGPQSKQVIDHVLTRDWGTRRPVFLKGNHEEVFLLTLGGNLEAARFWTRIGGAETMASYGVSQSLIDSGDTIQGTPLEYYRVQWKALGMVALPEGFIRYMPGLEIRIAVERVWRRLGSSSAKP